MSDGEEAKPAEAAPEVLKKTPRGPPRLPPGGPLAFLEAQLAELRKLSEPLRSPVPTGLGPLDMYGILQVRTPIVRQAARAEGETVATAAQMARDEVITDEQYDDHVKKVRMILGIPSR